MRTRDLPVFPLTPDPVRPDVSPDVAPVRHEFAAAGSADGPRIALLTLGCDKNLDLIGQRTTALVDNLLDGDEDFVAVARTVAQAHEVDGVTNLIGLEGTAGIEPGSMIEVEIVDALDYDLVAKTRTG